MRTNTVKKQRDIKARDERAKFCARSIDVVSNTTHYGRMKTTAKAHRTVVLAPGGVVIFYWYFMIFYW